MGPQKLADKLDIIGASYPQQQYGKIAGQRVPPKSGLPPAVLHKHRAFSTQLRIGV